MEGARSLGLGAFDGHELEVGLDVAHELREALEVLVARLLRSFHGLHECLRVARVARLQVADFRQVLALGEHALRHRGVNREHAERVVEDDEAVLVGLLGVLVELRAHRFHERAELLDLGKDLVVGHRGAVVDDADQPEELCGATENILVVAPTGTLYDAEEALAERGHVARGIAHVGKCVASVRHVLRRAGHAGLRRGRGSRARLDALRAHGDALGRCDVAHGEAGGVVGGDAPHLRGHGLGRQGREHHGGRERAGHQAPPEDAGAACDKLELVIREFGFEQVLEFHCLLVRHGPLLPLFRRLLRGRLVSSVTRHADRRPALNRNHKRRLPSRSPYNC